MSDFFDQPAPPTRLEEINQFHADAHQAAVVEILDKAAEIGAAADYLTSRLLTLGIAEEVEVVEVGVEMRARAAVHDRSKWARRLSKPPSIGVIEVEGATIGEGWVVSKADGRNTGRIALLNDARLVLCAPRNAAETDMRYDGALNLRRYPVHPKFALFDGYNYTHGASEATDKDKDGYLVSKAPAKVKPVIQFATPEAYVYANLEMIGNHMRKFFDDRSLRP